MKNKTNPGKDKVKFPYETLVAKYATETACLDAIFNARVSDTQKCPCCNAFVKYSYKKVNNRKAFQCGKCKTQVYPMAGTVFDHTHVDLSLFFRLAIDKIAHNTGFSATKVAFLYSLSDATAWKLLMRIRNWMALANYDVEIEGYVAIDETGINTGTKGMGRKWKRRRGFGSDNITPCVSMLSSDGKVISKIVTDREEHTLLPLIVDNVSANAIISTDEFKSYGKLKQLGFEHGTVNHSKGQFRNENFCSNRAEGYFGHVKPNLKATYRNITEPHAQAYMDEHDFRYNVSDLPLEERFNVLLACLPPLFEEENKMMYKKVA